mmetsp:Transcript_54740/g.86918  ORF Transcript_54740/g.86918 Transcript_54740/m.86918 type:complete len:336 (-) Transcript_54740:79-1086(-)
MTVHRGLLSFLASSRKKFEEDLAALLPSRDADGQELDQMEPLQNKDNVDEEEDERKHLPEYEEILRQPIDEEAEMPQAEELEEAEIGEVEQAEVEDEQEQLLEKEAGDEQIVDEQSDKEAEMPQAEELEAESGEAAQMTDDKSGDKAEAQDVDPDNMSPKLQQQLGAPLEAVRPLETPCVAELSPLAEPLEEPLEEEDSELEAEEVGDVKMHLARRRKRLETQLFATGRRRSKADGWLKQEMKAEPMPLKEKREATFVKRELDRGTSADGQQSSPARSLLKRRRRGPGEEDGICESESPAKQGRVMRGLPRSDLLRMAGNLERRYLCSDSLAVTA